MASNASKTHKVPISALPLASPSQLLIHNLTPDQHTPSVAEFRDKVLTTTPSIQRRARLISPQSHYSFVTPLPLPFPYQIEPPVPPVPTEEKGAYIEKWLAEREAIHPRDDIPSHSLKLYYAKNRDQPRELIGLSDTVLRDCLPNLDVGDAFAVIGAPTLANSFDDEGDGLPWDSESAKSAREQLVDVLGGQNVLMSIPSPDADPQSGFAPWSLRYSGHQFGSWAGQLGDGRAISILATPHPSDPNLTYELQLKGAGRTPFARSADGLAVLRSSIREYLVAEAMYALGIPTTRSLALVSLPALPVARERMETGCITTRVAPSFIRVGSFEALNGPTNMFFFGGGQQDPHWEGLRILGEWVSDKVLRLDRTPDEAWGKKLIMNVARRNAKMVAGWQAYGFMHGVINTDNVSVLGLTIDYGPYSFMDVFDRMHICNHTDEGGRYAYKYQPDMIHFALRALLNALSPLIAAEQELGDKAVAAGWAENVSAKKIQEWSEKGVALVKDELTALLDETIMNEYQALMRKRLALITKDSKDETELFTPLLDIMENHNLDFHRTFRTLTKFRPRMLVPREVSPTQPNGATAVDLEVFMSELLSHTPDPEWLDHQRATHDWLAWLEKFSARIEGEREEWAKRFGPNVDADKERERAGKAANPRFVLRQWVLEEVIAKVERDSTSGKRVLAKVMHMACNPFEAWGAEDDERPEAELDAEEKEERRYCGMGDKRMLGFQCSCSS